MPISLIMGYMFPEGSPEAELRANKRRIERSIREVELEIGRARNQETEKKRTIRALARQPDSPSALKLAARELVQARSSIAKLTEMKLKMQSALTRVHQSKTSAAVVGAVQGVTAALKHSSALTNPHEMSRLIQSFDAECERADMGAEILSDAMDEPGDEDEADELTAQVLEELGLDVLGDLASVPGPPKHAGEASRARAASKQS